VELNIQIVYNVRESVIKLSLQIAATINITEACYLGSELLLKHHGHPISFKVVIDDA